MTFGLVKGSRWPTNNLSLYYGVSIESSLPSLHLVLHSQTAAIAVWLRETSLHYHSAHSSKTDTTFDREPHLSAKNRYLSATSDTFARVHKWVYGYWTNVVSGGSRNLIWVVHRLRGLEA